MGWWHWYSINLNPCVLHWESKAETLCNCGFWVFFPLLHAPRVGELCPIMAKPVHYESHPELTSQFWRCCLKYCLDFKGHFRNKWNLRVFFFFWASWIVKFHSITFVVLMQLCQCCEKTCQLYITKQKTKQKLGHETKKVFRYSEIMLHLKVLFLCHPCWCKSSTVFSVQNVIKQLSFMWDLLRYDVPKQVCVYCWVT